MKCTKKKSVVGKVRKKVKLNDDMFLFDIESSFLGKNARPGQFVNVKVTQEGTDPLLRIPLGIHKISASGIALLFKVVGKGTELLSKIDAGEAIDIVGPLGNGFDLSCGGLEKNTKPVLIGGGYGVSPLFALAQRLKKKNKTGEFLLGVRKKQHVVCAKEIRALGMKLKVSTEDGSLGTKGLVTDILLKTISGRGKRNERIIIFACGPEAMTRAVVKIAKQNDIQAQVTMDEYMACGIGACRGCAVKTTEGYKLACFDGPVFGAKILPDGSGDTPDKTSDEKK